MKNAIVGISVGIVSILMGQASILSNTASAQAYGESVYGGGIYNDSRPYSPDRGDEADADMPPGKEPSTPGDTIETTPPGGPKIEGHDEHSNQPDIGSQPDNMDGSTNSTDPGSQEDLGNPPKSEPDTLSILKWIRFGAISTAFLLIWAINRRRRSVQ